MTEQTPRYPARAHDDCTADRCLVAELVGSAKSARCVYSSVPPRADEAEAQALAVMQAVASAIASRDGRVDAGWLMTSGLRAATAALTGMPTAEQDDDAGVRLYLDRLEASGPSTAVQQVIDRLRSELTTPADRS